MILANLLLAASVVSLSPIGDLPRGIGTWDPKILGNHRIVLQVANVPEGAMAVRVHIPWRRRDKHPETIDTVITDSTGHLVKNVFRKEILREYGDLAFQPSAGVGTYYLYHLPHITHGTYYPSVQYTPPIDNSSPDWRLTVSSHNWTDLPAAEAVRFESISALDAFTPMEVIAAPSEIERLLQDNPDKNFLVFPEDRHLSIRMWDDLPVRWASRGANTPFQGTSMKGEYYSLQLGVWAARSELHSLNVRFSDLRLSSGKGVIPAAAMTSFNTEGVDYAGKPFSIDVSFPKGQVQPLWCGIDVPAGCKPGTYEGIATVSASQESSVEIPISLKVDSKVAKDHGDDRPEDMTRLRWLNSRLGEEPEVVQPFLATSPLGARVDLGENGFFKQVSRSVLYPKNAEGQPVRLLARPMNLEVEGPAGVLVEKPLSNPKKEKLPGGELRWTAESQIGALHKALQGKIEFDGAVDFLVDLSCDQDCELRDIRLQIPLRSEVAQYFMGMGLEGGKAPEELDWKWSVRNNQEGAWVGNPECGLLFALRDEHYVRPLNTNFYHQKPLLMPTSWDNEGRGGVRIQRTADTYSITCHSGPRKMKKGDHLHFNLHMILTPSKPIDPRRQFSERYFHAYKPLAEIQAEGANVVNIHHATEINPWINYPFTGFTPSADGSLGAAGKMKAYVEEAHRRGMKVKIYDTIRELSNRTSELFMLKSLGHEVFSTGKGGGGSWLREHLDDDYISAWHATEVGDAAIVNSGTSRWHNYYIEGLDWLARKVGIDGLYLDDVAFDRTTMLRVRRVLERRIRERDPRAKPVIDLHSANQHDDNDGWNNSALLYMDLMPYLDRLWFGEEFNYDKDPNYWLVEMSGIPFGLMGEMLQNGGNPWRGMLFGMTARRPWSGDPRPLWKFWDGFGLKDSEMVGWWRTDCPVHTDTDNVLATVYLAHSPQGARSVLISLGSWAKNPEMVKLKIDWKSIGMDPKHAILVSTPIDKFQLGRQFEPDDPIPVEPGKGWLLTVSQR